MSLTPIVIVDKNDNPIGQSTVPEARAKGLVVRISRVMVESSDGKKILLQKRAEDSGLYPGRWDNSAAGHVDLGEDYLTAAKRELHEEIGIKADNLEAIGKYYNEEKAEGHILNQFNRVYRYVTDRTPTEFPDGEVSDVRWISLEELKQMIEAQPKKLTNGLIKVIRSYY